MIQIPFDIHLQSSGAAFNFFRMPRSLGKVFGFVLQTNNVGNMISRTDGSVVLQHVQRHEDMRLRFRIWIFFRMFAQTLGNDILVQGQFILPHFFGELFQMSMDVVDDLFPFLSRQNLVDDEPSRIFGLYTPISSDQIQPLEFLGLRAIVVHDERRILFLLEKQHGSVNPIDLQFQSSVQLVDFSFDPLSELSHFGQFALVSYPGVDHDGVGISVNDLQPDGILRHLDGALQYFPSHGRDQGGDGLGVEAGMGESQASVHGVGGEFERLLPHVELVFGRRIVGLFHHVLDVSAAFHQRFDHAGQDSHAGVAVRERRQDISRRCVVFGRFRRYFFLMRAPFHGGETKVVFLNDAGIETVEVQEQDAGVVEPPFGFQHQPSAEFGLFSRRLLLSESSFGHDVLEGMKFVEQEEFVPFGPVGSLDRAGPSVAGDVGELFGQRQHLQFVHEFVDQLGVPQGVQGELHHRLSFVVPQRHFLRLYFLPSFLELGPRETGETVGSLLPELLRRQVGIAENPSPHDPGQLAVVHFAGGEGGVPPAS
mmetsp:Transcript_39120/g.91113  ORF Transcript_39120/g.91113 Transcript_39120/m.91113 type:complete len:538 (+) Transcript_39120:844-2457(+)